MIEALLYDGFEYVIFLLDEIFATAVDGEFGLFVDVELEYTDTIKITTCFFPIKP